MRTVLLRNKIWLIPLCLGAIIPPLVWFFCYRDYIVPGTKARRSSFRISAQTLHVKEDDLIALARVEDKMEDKIPPTEADWQQIKAFTTGKDIRMQALAVRTLSVISKFGHKEECIALVDSVLNNPANQNDDALISYSLVSLHRMQAPDWKVQLDRFRNYSGPLTSSTEAKLQRKDGTGN